MVRHIYTLGALDKAATCRLDVAKSHMTRPPFPIITAVSAGTRPRSCTGTNPRRANARDNLPARPLRSGRQPQRRCSCMIDHVTTSDFNRQTLRP
jgi:hypothetical protein